MNGSKRTIQEINGIRFEERIRLLEDVPHLWSDAPRVEGEAVD
jgi:hypothetical protein